MQTAVQWIESLGDETIALLGFLRGPLHRFLQDGFENMVPHFLAGTWIAGTQFGGEYLLPSDRL